MSQVRVFYSWSSDNDPRVCRNLIKTALQEACESLTAEFEESDRPVELDHDTKGETGSPEITETIKRKIRECDFFIADLTPVTIQKRPGGKIRLLPNPNVMFELGYAFGSIDGNRILGVINTAFAGDGREEKGKLVEGVLPFNLRHRSHPRCYELEESADKTTLRKERGSLIKLFTEQVRSVVEASFNSVGPSHEPHEPLEGRVSTFIRENERIVTGHFPINWRNESAQVFVRFIPDLALDLTPLDLDQACEGQLRVIPQGSTNSGDFGLNQYGFAACAISALPGDVVISRDIIQFFRTGEVWLINGSSLRRHSDYVDWSVENIFAWSAVQAAHFLANVECSGAGKMIFGLTGIKGRDFIPPISSSHLPPFHKDWFFEVRVEKCNRETLGGAADQAASRLWAEVALKRPFARDKAPNSRGGFWDKLFINE